MGPTMIKGSHRGTEGIFWGGTEFFTQRRGGRRGARARARAEFGMPLGGNFRTEGTEAFRVTVAKKSHRGTEGTEEIFGWLTKYHAEALRW